MNLNYILERAVDENASDIHICVGLPPVIRVNGELIRLGEKVFSPQDCIVLAKQCLTQKMYEEFLQKGEVDIAYSLQGKARFRVNVYKQKGTCAIALRHIIQNIPDFDELGIPKIAKELAMKKRGLILVTGPTGHGKSTTLAAMIDYINKNTKNHIITVEDPIEYVHKHDQSIIHQREIGVDTMSFSSSLRASLREDPDVILVGEMRDLETISIALTAAETGHLVLSTLHTVGSAKTIDRIIDVFPPEQQEQIRVQLSSVIVSIISQQLLPNKTGDGRCLATEVMVNNGAISNLIRENRIAQINTSIQTGADVGMYSMDYCIASLLNSDQITYETAMYFASDQRNIKNLLTKR